MARDTQGNDLESVKVPITGFAAIGPKGGTSMTKAQLEAASLSLPSGYEYLGLFTTDGGPAEASEAEDPLEFFQIGYTLPGDDGKLSETLVLAEDNDAVRTLRYGDTGTGASYVMKSAVPEGRYPYLRVTRYRNGTEMRRAGLVTVTAIEPVQETRGEIRAVSVTFSFVYQDELTTSAGGDPVGGMFIDVYMDRSEEDPTPANQLTVTPRSKTMAVGAMMHINVEDGGQPVGSAATVVYEGSAAQYLYTGGEHVVFAVEPGEASLEFTYVDPLGTTKKGTVNLVVSDNMPALEPTWLEQSRIPETGPIILENASGLYDYVTATEFKVGSGKAYGGNLLYAYDGVPLVVDASFSQDNLAKAIVKSTGEYDDLGSSRVSFSWNDGEEGGYVYLAQTDFTVVPPQLKYGQVPGTFTLGISGTAEGVTDVPSSKTLVVTLGAKSNYVTKPGFFVTNNNPDIVSYQNGIVRGLSNGQANVTVAYFPPGATLYQELDFTVNVEHIEYGFDTTPVLAPGAKVVVTPQTGGSYISSSMGQVTARAAFPGINGNDDISARAYEDSNSIWRIEIELGEALERRTTVTVRWTSTNGVVYERRLTYSIQ